MEKRPFLGLSDLDWVKRSLGSRQGFLAFKRGGLNSTHIHSLVVVEPSCTWFDDEIMGCLYTYIYNHVYIYMPKNVKGYAMTNPYGLIL